MGKKRNLKMWVVMAVFLVGMAPAIAAGEVIYVDADASPGGDGSSWGTAYKYLQDALVVAQDGNDIWVAEGTYKPDANTANPGSGDRTATFQLINGVAIYGGFAGGETTLNERDWETNETILSGDLNGDDIGFTNNGENSYQVVTGSGTDATAILDGFTITAGNADGSDPYNKGGGMFNESGSPTVTNCTFSGNSAGGSGGGMATGGGSPTVTNCTFSGNSANYSGGGMANYNGSSPTVTNCTFSGNTAGTNGGGMQNWGGSPTVTNCTFSGNSAGRNGGGMITGGGSPTVTNCTFSGNRANWHGGGMWNENTISPPTITNCTFSGNSAQYYGGGMKNQESNPTITNCILWGNTATTAPEIYNSGQSPTVTYSDIAGGYTGTGNINADPLFADADLRLSAGSPCIDAGDNTAVPGGVTTDLDGKPRFVDDPATTDTGSGTPPIVDMGAYEYQGAITIYVDGDATGANDGSNWEDAFKYLQDALADANSNPDINEIRVAEGTYKPDANTANPGGTGERTATFQLINGVALYGGYAGVNEPDPNERNWRTNETILSGDLDGNDVQVSDPCDLLTEPTRGENSYHVVTGSGTTGTAVLDGFTITAGNARYMGDDLYPYDCGGGMYNNSGSPTVVNCTFSRNSAVDVGGGMSNYNSGPTVMNCTFSGNSAAYDGGGMDNENSSPMVSNCAFIGNLATGDSWGGGMCNANKSSPTVTNCTFSGNTAYYGGGMYNDTHNGGSNPTLTNCILWGNTAPTGPQIYNEAGSSPTVSYSDVQGGWPGMGNVDEDPLFIGPNGLDGIPGTADDREEGDVYLRGYSPCINAGDPAGDYSGQVDIDRQPRVAYGRVDMGADEVFPAAGDFEPDGDMDFVDFAIFANHWLLGVEN